MMKIFILCTSVLGLTLSAWAEQKPARKLTLDYEDELVIGSQKGPNMMFTQVISSEGQKRLIPLRNDFLREMKRSANKKK